MNEIGSSIRPLRRLPPLLSLRAFEAAAAHLSFQRAALELSVTPSAISHQVRALEDTLGQPLFRRLTRQLALTPAGQRLFADLRMGFDMLEAGVDKLRRPAASQERVVHVAHVLRVAAVAPRVFGRAEEEEERDVVHRRVDRPGARGRRLALRGAKLADEGVEGRGVREASRRR